VMTSNWTLPSKLIPTATIDATVTSFIDVIEMTRCSAKFVRWQQKTVSKAFKWVDTIKSLIASIDAIQLEVAMTKVRRTNVIFVDLNPKDVLLHPCRVLIKAILSSPLLPSLEQRALILRCTYREAVLRLGEEVTQKIFRDVTDVCMTEKASGDSANLKIGGVNVNENVTSDYQALYELPCDDVILASQLMVACCGKIKQSEDSLIPAETIAMIKKAAHNHSISLKMLCIGLSCSPCSLYCACAPPSNPNDDLIPPHTASVIRTPTNKPRTDMLINPSIDDFYNMTKNHQLWEIITDEAVRDISRFLDFDENFNTFQLLLREAAFVAVAVPSITSLLSDKVAGFEAAGYIDVAGEEGFLSFYNFYNFFHFFCIFVLLVRPFISHSLINQMCL
jgi:hypothetical protein